MEERYQDPSMRKHRSKTSYLPETSPVKFEERQGKIDDYKMDKIQKYIIIMSAQ